MAVGSEGLETWMARMERTLAGLERDVETCPISKRRGRWIERSAPAWRARGKGGPPKTPCATRAGEAPAVIPAPGSSPG